MFSSMSSSKARTSSYHFFLSLDFHEMWYSVMSAGFFTEVKRQWVSTGMGDHFSVLLVARTSRPKPVLVLF